jgi:hypothetical protein
MASMTGVVGVTAGVGTALGAEVGTALGVGVGVEVGGCVTAGAVVGVGCVDPSTKRRLLLVE